MKQSKLLFIIFIIYSIISCQTSKVEERKEVVSEEEEGLEFSLELLTEQEQYELVMDVFINHVKNENIDLAINMISPNMIKVNGVEAAKEFILYEIMPFFKTHVEIYKMKSIAGATDSFGNNGMSFYYYSTDDNGNNRPFTVYVISENNKLVIANIIVNEFIKGRHEFIE